jgi:hypothetical protein
MQYDEPGITYEHAGITYEYAGDVSEPAIYEGLSDTEYQYCGLAGDIESGI